MSTTETLAKGDEVAVSIGGRAYKGVVEVVYDRSTFNYGRRVEVDVIVNRKFRLRTDQVLLLKKADGTS